MQKIILGLIASIVFSFNVKAQPGAGQISGQVVDKQSKSLPGATIILALKADTTVKQIRIADKNGVFVFDKLANGTYLLKVSNIGFHIYVDDHLDITNARQTISLPAIILQAIANQSLK